MTTRAANYRASATAGRCSTIFVAAYEYLRHHPECTGRVGVVGFCFGGYISNMMAVRCPDLGAAVPSLLRFPTQRRRYRADPGPTAAPLRRIG